MKCPQCGFSDEKIPKMTSRPPAGPKRPNGLAELKATFGEPGKVKFGLVNVVVKGSPVGRVKFYCHELLVPLFTWVFQQISDRGLGADLLSFDGCYNPRLMRGSKKMWSTHAWAVACDTNANGNFKAPGTPGQNRISAIFAEAGFVQLKHDPMHHQFLTGY